MSDPIFIFVVFALVLSAFIKGSLGMGFSTICLAILANIIELKTAISIVVLPSLLSNAMVMIEAGNLRISLRLFFTMILAGIPGMAIGLLFLRQSDNTVSVLILSIVLILYGCWGWANHEFRIADKLIPKLNPVIGFATGIVNGATGSQIFPIMPYLLSLNISKDVLVQTINLSFTLNSLIMLVFLYSMNTFDANSMVTYSLGIIPVAIGVWLGGKVRKQIPETRFKRMVMILIVTLGLLLLVS
ncbi:MAG: sulfite exporter TauE/SafE family protein [Arenicella sp.]|nr:sulfite exporter TauE/SafE family protein [Arenicella sp.]